ncbi:MULTISPECIES: DUF736 domain-containing protein [Rhodopseudomonas]|uniref:DUF736 domain-containing protein n=1 Tax=Rhodopseudomonas palustris TaxID=1076 RepID=A0A0D7F5R4_RHOPL|nr:MULTISPECIES: DUF736 domain-containing protein [Rhodopseudomonas]KIZ48121.1 hypothetical protein OO17_00635 [Rhodopseudomonas palustris]MDF3810753.1 DUF736 domain-containing protein [Rhodopseudomonas sp. BAL398]WOK20705.1 DUF736 domain-containing protein [Rhodopseudomonas sp. BAL398]
MAQIGTFKRTKTGLSGRIRTLAFDADLVLVPIDKSDAENAPDYRIHLANDASSEVGPEVGAGWKRTGERAGDYISLQLDDPSFAQPIRANLFQADDNGAEFSLLWNRPPRRHEAA